MFVGTHGCTMQVFPAKPTTVYLHGEFLQSNKCQFFLMVLMMVFRFRKKHISGKFYILKNFSDYNPCQKYTLLSKHSKVGLIQTFQYWETISDLICFLLTPSPPPTSSNDNFNPNPPRGSELVSDWLNLRVAWVKPIRSLFFRISIARVGKTWLPYHDHTMIMAKHGHDHVMVTAWQPCFLEWSSWFSAWLWYG